MSARLLALAMAVTWSTVPVRAADVEKQPSPAVLLRISSFSELIADIKYVAALEKQEASAKRFEEDLANFTGKDHGGIDIKRPAALLGLPTRNGTELQPLVLIPIANEALFLAFVERHFGKPQKDKNDAYSVPFMFRLHFRFARGYVHVSTEPDLLAKERLRDPATMLATERTGTVIVAIYPDRVPEQYRDMSGQQLRWVLTNPSPANDPAETELQKKLRLQVVESLSRKLNAMVKEARELVLQFGIDRKTEELFGDLTLSAKPETALARDLTDLGRLQSRFAGSPSDPTALRLLLHWSLPEALTEAIRPTVDEAIRNVMANAAAGTEREQAVRFVEALDPTLRAGELNVGFHLLSPDKEQRYTLVMGFQVKQGLKIEQALRGLIKSLPESDRDKFKFDVVRGARGPIHRADVQHDFSERALSIFGGQPLYYAIRDDAIWIAVGPGGLNGIKEAVAAKPQAAPPLEYTMSFRRLAPLLAGDAKNVSEFVKIAERTFGKNGGNDQIRFVVEGGKTLRARVTVKAAALRFLSETEGRGRPYWFYWW